MLWVLMMNKTKFIEKINPLILNGVAHRGLHNEKYTENGINAFKWAIENNVAFELDVHLTKDKKIVVCHDDNLIRTTGKDGIIEELTLSEIKSNYQLFDGSQIPTLSEVLEITNEKVPIVVEIKVHNANYKELTKHTLKVLEKIKDKRNIMLISFEPRALICARKAGFMRGLLVCEKDKWVFKFRHLFESVDLEYTMIKDKNVKRYQKKHFVNVWTIENEEALKAVDHKVDTITFQHLDLDKIKNALN